MKERQTCIDCAKRSPETETNYTLISAQFGWRLTRQRSPTGDISVEWRCPDCWRAFKATKGDSLTPSERLGQSGSNPSMDPRAVLPKRRSVPPGGRDR